MQECVCTSDDEVKEKLLSCWMSPVFFVVVVAEGPNLQLDCISALPPSVHVFSTAKRSNEGIALSVCAPSLREVRVSHPHYLSKLELQLTGKWGRVAFL